MLFFMKTLRKIIFYNRETGSRPHLALHWLVNLAYIVLWSLGVGLISLYFGKVNYGRELFYSYFQHAGLFLLNILPVLAVAVFFLLLCNRVWPAVLGSGLIITVLALINHFKLMFRDDPLLASDVRYFAEAAQISSRYDVTLTPLILAAFAVILAASVFAFFFMRARFYRPLPRLISAAAFIAVCLGLYFGAYTSEKVYRDTANLEVSFSTGHKMSQWNATDQYCCRGFLYPLLHSTVSTAVSKPDGYTKENAQAALNEHGDADIPEEKKVNFISIMLEAYCDFSAYDGIFSFETDPYEYFHELQSQSVTGTLVTNIFAAGTIDTERCYITGSTELYEYRGAADSYARYFDGQGYFTEFCHPCYGWFYNRQNVMEYLGFESTHFFEDRYELPADWGIMRDDRFFPDLAVLFDEAIEAGKPYFNFSVSYQNHGPYPSDSLFDPETEYVPRGTLSEESYNILNNYFWNIKGTNDYLRDLVTHLEESREPVVLVLFGDHKPWLGDNSSVYAELGIDISRTSDESFYNYYCTEYTIWANSAAKSVLGNDFRGDGGDFSPCFLMMKVFDLCGYTGTGYMQSLRELYAAGVDVVNISGRFRENGALTDKLSDGAQPLLDKVLWMQYYRMHDWAKEAG